MADPLLCIQHFFNEEYLLPWWIDFHRELFDHVIFIDHGSNDGSVREITTRAPHWEVRTSRLTDFDAVAADQEVMEIERTFDGWKIVLNTTEFLWAPTIRQELAAIERGPFAFALEGTTMVDRRRNKPLRATSSILEQRPWCVNVDSIGVRLAVRIEAMFKRRGRRSFWVPRGRLRRRYLHGAPDGRYETGRHETALPVHPNDSEWQVLWLGYSPWTREFRRRKRQIGPRISESSAAEGYGFQHFMSGWELELVRALLAIGSERFEPLVRSRRR